MQRKYNKGVVSAEVEGGATVSVSESATNTVSEVSVDGPCEGQSGRVTKNFRKVLESGSLRDMAGACKGAMDALVLKRREPGTVGSEQKCKSLQGR